MHADIKIKTDKSEVCIKHLGEIETFFEYSEKKLRKSEIFIITVYAHSKMSLREIWLIHRLWSR